MEIIRSTCTEDNENNERHSGVASSKYSRAHTHTHTGAKQGGARAGEREQERRADGQRETERQMVRGTFVADDRQMSNRGTDPKFG